MRTGLGRFVASEDRAWLVWQESMIWRRISGGREVKAIDFWCNGLQLN